MRKLKSWFSEDLKVASALTVTLVTAITDGEGGVNVYIFLSILITMEISFKVKVLSASCSQNLWDTYEKYSYILTSWILQAAYIISGMISSWYWLVLLYWNYCFPTMFTLLHSKTFRICKITRNKTRSGCWKKTFFVSYLNSISMSCNMIT